MSKINSRSPYYINISATNLTQVDMQLYVYTGTQTTDRDNIFNLQSFAVNENVTFEIGEIVRDYIYRLLMEIMKVQTFGLIIEQIAIYRVLNR